MKSILCVFLLTVFIVTSNGFLHRKPLIGPTNETRYLASVKIYSNLAEIIQPLSKLPLEFSAEDWEDIRPDSLTLVGTNVTVTQQTITEKKKSLNNAQVYVRSPSSSSTETKYIKATLIDEQRNLIKLFDKDISKTPVFFTSSDILYDEEPPQSKHYVNFTYDTTDAVYVSYLRSNLNWKTSYQLNLFEESKKPVLISMADIRNNGQAKIDIEHAELLGGDINLQAVQQHQLYKRPLMYEANSYGGAPGMGSPQAMSSQPSISQVEEVAGLYVFTIDKPFSIEGKTNHLLPMFRPQVTIERYASVSTYFSNSAGSTTGKAQRSYRISSDRFLSSGNCIIRESDRLVGETSLPDLAAKNKHDFSVGQDADIVYKQNATLFSSNASDATTSSYSRTQSPSPSRTRYVYDISVLLKNFKKDRPVKIEYEQRVHGTTIKFITSNKAFTSDSTTIKYKTTIAANDEQLLSYRIELIN